MGESHTKGEQRHYVIRGAAPRNGLPGRKDYVYRGTGASEPPEVAAARLRHRAVSAEIERRCGQLAAEAMPDPAPGYEWQRELAEDDELATERDRYQAAMAAVRAPDPLPAPPPVTAPARCRRCRYLTTSAGHRVTCDE